MTSFLIKKKTIHLYRYTNLKGTEFLQQYLIVLVLYLCNSINMRTLIFLTRNSVRSNSLKGLLHHQLVKIHGLENLSLWQKLYFFAVKFECITIEIYKWLKY